MSPASLIVLVSLYAIAFAADSANVMKIKVARPKSQAKDFYVGYDGEAEGEFSGVDADIEERSFLPPDLEIINSLVDSMEENRCGRDAREVMSAVKRRERWAYQMLDSSAKLPEGVLYGTFYQLGNFDECLGIKQPTREPPSKAIKGQYCLADITVDSASAEGRTARSFRKRERKRYRGTFNSTLHWAICLPSSCSGKEAERFLGDLLEYSLVNASVVVEVDERNCYRDEDVPLSASEIVYGVIVGLFGIFVVLATGYHFHHIRRKNRLPVQPENGGVGHQNQERSRPSTGHSLLVCFSLIHNVKKFLNTNPSSANLECISGIKFISMCFILGGHALIFLISSPVQNIQFYDQAIKRVSNGIFINNPLLVDTFLFVGGFLMSFLLLAELQKRNGHVNFLVLYAARYVRLTPSYLVVLGFYCTWFLRMGNGPMWNSKVLLERDRCLESWWVNILYVNNYVATDNLCMFQSWYLSVDTHMFVIAPAVIYPLWKSGKLGLWILGSCIAVSALIPIVITYVDKLDPTLLVYAPEMVDLARNPYFINTYVKTHMRASSYFVGILSGYVVYKLQSKGCKITPKILTAGWIIATLFGVVSMFSITVFYLPDHEYNPTEAALYSSLHRVAWCIAIAWVVTACITQNAPLVDKFLSWKIFMPLCRITYCSYLVNGIVELYSSSTVRSPVYMSYFHLGSSVVSHIAMTFAFAFLLCILFESPIHGIEKIMLARDGNKKKPAIAKEGEDGGHQQQL